MEFEYGLDEVEGEAAEAVAGGRHNLRDTAADDADQYGLKARSPEVDAGRDVAEEFVVRVSVAEELFLAFEVGFLLGRGDAGVEDALARGGGSSGGSGGSGSGAGPLPLSLGAGGMEPRDVVQVVGVGGVAGLHCPNGAR